MNESCGSDIGTGCAEVRKKIEKVYSCFFEKISGDPSITATRNREAGDVVTRLEWNDGEVKRHFACYPYVGSRYGERTRILFIGSDIGRDESPEGIQRFKERRESIETPELNEHNPHIAGTYFAALRSIPEFEKKWEHFHDSEDTCQTILRSGLGLPRDNPLSFVGLTNYWKWVVVSAAMMNGGGNRKHCDPELELQLLECEINAYDPEIVVFQGVPLFCKRRTLETVNRIASSRIVRVHDHPSARHKRHPEDVARSFMSFQVANKS